MASAMFHTQTRAGTHVMYRFPDMSTATAEGAFMAKAVPV
jgi:hypothetical protein